MKLMTWNCRIGGFRRKSASIAHYKPDVLAVQEVEPLDSVRVFGGQPQPTFWDRVPYQEHSRRGIGLFLYTGTSLRRVDAKDTLPGFRRFEAIHKGVPFNVIAVWTAATKDPAKSYRQVHEGLRRHADWIAGRDTVLLGDLNDNASFRGDRWSSFMELLRPFGLVSAYHEDSKERFGAETKHTHFHGGKLDAAFHIDYCFVPTSWAPRIQTVTVGAFSDDWRRVSDHVPLIVDVADAE